jgi:hypothetical protein
VEILAVIAGIDQNETHPGSLPFAFLANGLRL